MASRYRIPLRVAPLLIFLVSFFVRCFMIVAMGQYHDLERYEMERAAISFARTNTLADPYVIPTGPTAHVMPGYPIVMGMVFRYFGTGIPAELVKEGLSCAAVSAQYALLPAAAIAFGMPPEAGLVGGIVGALLPLKYQTEVTGDWEAPWAALAFLLVSMLTVRVWREGRFGFARGLKTGVGWGAALLISASLAPIVALATVVGLVWFRRRFLSYALALSLGVLAVLSPWAVRNAVRLGKPLLTRSNLGLELRVSNNDLAQPAMADNISTLQEYHPYFNRREALRVRQVGEVQYNREEMAAAMGWIRTHFRRFLQLTAERVVSFWFPPARWYREILLSLPTLSGIAGLFLLWPVSRLAALYSVISFVSFPLIYYVIQSHVRYRYPLDWMLLLLASYAAVRLAETLQIGRSVRSMNLVLARAR